ncbi:DUF4062 domain-containing protein [Pseudoxanthomonas sp. JBR18]|uniref:DUF4062 domain-containing protein n=1 Tax=Pseudoxanthomonas sp. JBR18 TaxID=2969308 RepID=UPI0023051C98|nr:DUF4062 domain-containing protein [Pseudoxanthomonas sp. JBR18]WCE04921.1 DUF4062 domain-containing protein [Pseudoxanthomonas sp. JBR18]
MAKPRVFVSSTYFDLKYVRASLDVFIKSLGYEPILSEKGDIAYAHDRALDESCYREAESSDLFVLIIGGRYGSESGADAAGSKGFYERYESITKTEYETAARRDVPIYIFIESGVYAEYLTYQRNKGLESINYAHVDSVNIFRLIEEILAKPRNNQVKTFERYDDIESWLRDQWAGLFRDLLARQSESQQLTALTEQVNQLSQINETMKNYLEAVLSKTVDNSQALISSEEGRLKRARINALIRANNWFKYFNKEADIGLSRFINLVSECEGVEDFSKKIAKEGLEVRVVDHIRMTLEHSAEAKRDLVDAISIVKSNGYVDSGINVDEDSNNFTSTLNSPKFRKRRTSNKED